MSTSREHTCDSNARASACSHSTHSTHTHTHTHNPRIALLVHHHAGPMCPSRRWRARLQRHPSSTSLQWAARETSTLRIHSCVRASRQQGVCHLCVATDVIAGPHDFKSTRVRSAHELHDNCDRRYSPIGGTPSLCKAISDFHHRRYGGPRLNPATEVAVMTSGTEALFSVRRNVTVSSSLLSVSAPFLAASL
jgi:hypothetical protein